MLVVLRVVLYKVVVAMTVMVLVVVVVVVGMVMLSAACGALLPLITVIPGASEGSTCPQPACYD